MRGDLPFFFGGLAYMESAACLLISLTCFNPPVTSRSLLPFLFEFNDAVLARLATFPLRKIAKACRLHSDPLMEGDGDGALEEATEGDGDKLRCEAREENLEATEARSSLSH